MKTQPVALVTGATSGIGEATAYRLQAKNYVVFAVGRNPAALDALRTRGLQARTLDVTDEAAVTGLVDEINTDYGAVDVLVNSAGLPLRPPRAGCLERCPIPLRGHRRSTSPGTSRVTRNACSGAGTIVTIGSTGGRFTSPGAGAYHISKYGVEAFSLALRADGAQFGVRVVLIDPTGVRIGSSKPNSKNAVVRRRRSVR